MKRLPNPVLRKIVVAIAMSGLLFAVGMLILYLFVPPSPQSRNFWLGAGVAIVGMLWWMTSHTGKGG